MFLGIFFFWLVFYACILFYPKRVTVGPQLKEDIRHQENRIDKKVEAEKMKNILKYTDAILLAGAT